MPFRSLSPCRQSGCPTVTPDRYCKDHTQYSNHLDRHRGSAGSRGYDAAWQKIRKQALKRDLYLCQHCKNEGRATSAKDVDHIIPISIDPSKRLDLANLQSLCRSCHNKKTLEDQRRYRVEPTPPQVRRDTKTTEAPGIGN
jgi:5-methylcytosine-specific restriction protein A